MTGEPFLLAPIRIIAASWLSEDPRMCEDLLVGVCSIRPTRTSICREGCQTRLLMMLLPPWSQRRSTPKLGCTPKYR